MKINVMNIEKLKKILEDNKKDAQYYAILYDNSEYNIRFSDSKIISNRVSSNSFVEITSILDKKVGVSSTTDLSEESVIKCIKKSYSIALEAEENEEYTPLIEDEKYDDSTENSLNFEKEVSEIEDYLHLIFNKDKRIKIFGYITGEISNISIINSVNLLKRTTIPRFSYSMNIKNDKLTRSVWRSDISSVSNIDLLKNIYTQLLKDYKYTSIKKDLDPGRYKVVLSPSALGDLLMYMSFFLLAKDADEKRSPFKDLLGKKMVWLV